MKRLICLLVTLSMLLSQSIVTFAANSETEPKYGYINVEYSDAYGSIEKLSVMNYNNHIYAEANELGARLGYKVADKDGKYIAIGNSESGELPTAITKFYYNSCDVSHTLFNCVVDDYEAPFKTIKNEKGIWIPLEYSLLLLNSGSMIIGETLQITMPEKNITDMFYDLLKEQEFPFDWNRDFGYTDFDMNAIGGSSHLINVFNGLLEFDGASWAVLFQQFAQDFSAYDAKYGEDLALLICTNSDKELKAKIEQVEKLNDVFSEKGKVNEFLSEITVSDEDIKELSDLCEKYFNEIRNGNSSATYMYNRTYQQLENAIGNEEWYSELANSSMAFQKDLSKATNALEIGAKVAEVVSYMSEFSNQDQYATSALQLYLNMDNNSDLPEATKNAMQRNVEKLNLSIAEYSTIRFLEENIDDIIGDCASEVLGKQGNIALLTWDLASDFVPFISDGLSSANNFELALYATVFQTDTRMKYMEYRDYVFQNEDNITSENLTKLASYCYVYLKSCYIARDAAIASLDKLPKERKEQVLPLIEKQNAVNEEIAKYLAVLKTADASNRYLVFGFLPTDNEKYLEDYKQNGSDKHLLSIFQNESIIEHNNNGVTDYVDGAECRDANIYTAYYNKIIEMQAKYGVAFTVIQDEQSVLTGLCLATLIDFNGDGKEELLLAYYDGTPDVYGRPKHTMGIWEYRDNECKKLFETNEGLGDYYDITSFISIWRAEGKWYFYQPITSGGEGYNIWGYDTEFCKLGTIQYLNSDWASGYWINGIEVSEEDYNNYQLNFSKMESYKSWKLTDPDVSGLDLVKTVEEIDNTIRILNDAMKGENDVENKDSWKDAYIDFILEYGMTYDAWLGSYMETYKLVNVNNDEIPELYINFGSGAKGDLLCSYYDGSVIYQYMSDYGFSYMEGKNLFMDSGGHMDVYHDIVYSIDNGKFVVQYKGQYGAADNSNVQFDSNGYPIYDYYWNENKISDEVEYQRLLGNVYDIQKAQNPFDGAQYDSNLGRYVGNGLCDYQEIINAINEYCVDKNNSVDLMTRVTQISASSSLSENGKTHTPDLVVDGDLKTGWVEGTKGQGIGEEIIITFSEKSLVTGFSINAGYQKSESLYEKNSRPASVQVKFSNGESEMFMLNDINGQQVFTFQVPRETDSVSFVIESVYPGDVYEDTVISEISFY